MKKFVNIVMVICACSLVFTCIRADINSREIRDGYCIRAADGHIAKARMHVRSGMIDKWVVTINGVGIRLTRENAAEWLCKQGDRPVTTTATKDGIDIR